MSFTYKTIRQKPRHQTGRNVKKYSSVLARGFQRILVNFFKGASQKKSYWVGGLMVLLGFFVVYHVMTGLYHWVRGFDPKNILFTLGSDLKKDAHGYTNILLLGAGDETHDGFDLVDTIMVASIDYRKNSVVLFSIPRDFYINSQHSSRINEIYRNNISKKGDEGALQVMEEVVGKVVNLEIPYHAKVNFSGFVEMVDGLGGVDVEVTEDIVDPYYPNATEDGYQTFVIKAGSHTLDGETALKYVRSRKTTSDFDRSKRQHKVIAAVREKALSKKILRSPGAIKELLQSVSSNLSTNLSLREMIALAGYGAHMDRGRLITKVIHDDPSQEGGFLYTPERRLYNGAFVLIPDGEGYDLLHQYTHIVFDLRELFLEKPKIEILNGTRQGGVAGVLASRLNRFGFNVVSVSNIKNEDDPKKPIEKTTLKVYQSEEDREQVPPYKNQTILDALQQFVPGELVPVSGNQEVSSIDISIIVGKDYLEKK